MPELSEITGLRISLIKNVMRLSNKHVSMDAPLGGDSDNTSIGQTLDSGDENIPDCDERETAQCPRPDIQGLAIL